MKIGEIEFEKSDLFYQNGKVYRKTVSGLREGGFKCVRNIGQYKLYAFHLDCALPYTYYCLVDIKTNVVYKSDEYHYNFKDIQNSIVDALKSQIESEGNKL